MGVMEKRAVGVGDNPWWAGNAAYGDQGFVNLGQDRKAFSWEELAEQDILQWVYEKRQLFLHDQGLRLEVPNRFGLVRQDTQKILGLSSDRYTPPQPQESVEFVKKVVDGVAAVHMAGELDGGRILWVLLTLPGDIVVGENDRIRNHVLWTTSFDTSYAWSMFWTPIRVVCENTLAAAVGGAKGGYRLKQMGIKDRWDVEDARQALGLARAFGPEFQVMGNRLAQTPVTEEEKIAVLQRLFPIPTTKLLPAPAGAPMLLLPEPRRELLMPEFTRTVFEKRDVCMNLINEGKGNNGRTRWDLVNGVAEMADYVLGTDRKRTENLLFGDGRKLKEAVMEIATEDRLFGVGPTRLN